MSLNPKTSVDFISIGCNRLPQVAAWGPDGLLIYGAHNLIALYYPQDETNKGVFATLPGHTGRVNCVEFINRGNGLNQRNIAIISGSADKTGRIWKKSSDGQWVNSAVLLGHEGAITTVGVMRAKSILVEKDLFATGSADGKIKLWERTIEHAQDKIECIQTINVGVKYPLALALSYLPESNVPIMACGSTDKRISIYVQKNGQFHQTLSLQGHDNWVRSLAFAINTKPSALPDSSLESSPSFHYHYKLRDGDLLLASASQDKYVRIWKISSTTLISNNALDQPADIGILSSDIFTKLKENVRSDGKIQISTKAHFIDVDIFENGEENSRKQRYSVMFEALLMGHDDWVYSVCWHPPIPDPENKSNYYQPMVLLTASSDKSMMLWKPETETGQWVNVVRVGEIGGYALGFFGGLFGPDGKCIIAHGHTGAFHLWKNEVFDEDSQDWRPQVSISGHFNSVQSITWDCTSEYLLSASLDQTARLFAPWRRLSNPELHESISTWHEISRTQIHGYDIHCISFVNRWTYISGSDEKVLRVFAAPKTFVHSLAKLSQNEAILEELESRPVGANLPALGLSNKAISQGDIENFVKAAESEEFLSRQSYSHSSATPNSLVQVLEKPPFEEHLLQHTLWPEIDKLYGHGYEIVSVDSSHDGKYIASSCKSTSPEHAVIRLYSTDTWKEFPQPLQSHSLTVTKLKFSHNDKYLLSVSRDRFWSLFERCSQVPPYKLVAKNKVHTRIIWDCSWTHDDKSFATASRDKTVHIWTLTSEATESKQNQWILIATLKLTEAITAIDFAPNSIDGRYILCIGAETGKIHLYSSEPNDVKKWSMIKEFETEFGHVASINGLTWCPRTNSNSDVWQLASCGADWSVRIFNVEFKKS
ncbi:4245_t:CDS:10 [Ambispora gerdemannii]|uniref:Elongator complex protein 2 n=1 Tax=Ambispora gerdemannii TaxID=144530 RepID=A0A9N8W887_9GLOM|nr:4245_t:CDS:10 [Ambispora gerdemannii]